MRVVTRVFGARVEVASHRSTHACHSAAMPALRAGMEALVLHRLLGKGRVENAELRQGAAEASPRAPAAGY